MKRALLLPLALLLLFTSCAEGAGEVRFTQGVRSGAVESSPQARPRQSEAQELPVEPEHEEPGTEQEEWTLAPTPTLPPEGDTLEGFIPPTGTSRTYWSWITTATASPIMWAICCSANGVHTAVP